MHTNLIFAVVIYQGFLSQSTGKNSRLFVMTLFEPLAWACSIQFGADAIGRLSALPMSLTNSFIT